MRAGFGLAPSILAALGLLVSCSWPAGAAERPDNVTLSIVGSFPAQIVDKSTPTPGPSAYEVNARIEVRGQRVVYTTGDGRFEMRFDGSPALSTAPAECNGTLTNTVRHTTARAWFAGGMMALTRFSETTFPIGGACGGLTISVNETFGIRLVNGRCEFGLTTVHRRGGARPLQRTASIVPWQPCEATPPGRRNEPNVARVPAPAKPQPSGPPDAPRPVLPNVRPAAPESACTLTPAGAIISACLIGSCPADLPEDVKARLLITAPNVKENLRHIDAQLGALQALMNETKAAADTFERTCPGIGGACAARVELAAANTKLSDLYDALQKAPEEDIIGNTATEMFRTYQQPDCMNQINKQTSDRLDVALDIMQRAEKLLAVPAPARR